MPLLGVTSIIHAGINFMCQPDCWNIFRKIEIDVINATYSISPKSIIHAGIYWLTENVTTCMVIFT